MLICSDNVALAASCTARFWRRCGGCTYRRWTFTTHCSRSRVRCQKNSPNKKAFSLKTNIPWEVLQRASFLFLLSHNRFFLLCISIVEETFDATVVATTALFFYCQLIAIESKVNYTRLAILRIDGFVCTL